MPTPAAREPGWRHLTIVDKDGNQPKTINERWYDAKTGRLVQKGLQQVTQRLATPTANQLSPSMMKHPGCRAMLPTPNAGKGGGSSRSGSRRGETPSLQGMARKGMLPTPTTSDATGGPGSGGPNLRTALIPMPTAGDSKSSGSAGYSTESGRHSGVTLTDWAKGRLPTPRRMPTPKASDSERGGRGELLHTLKGSKTPRGMLPTPTAALGESGGSDCTGKRRPENLASHMKTLLPTLPTPIASDGAKDPSESLSRLLQTGSLKGVLPTPTTQDAKNNGAPSQHDRHSLPLNARLGGRLNPAFVEQMLGFPPGWTEMI